MRTRPNPQEPRFLLASLGAVSLCGANDQIAKRVAGWRGKVDINGQLGSLFKYGPVFRRFASESGSY